MANTVPGLGKGFEDMAPVPAALEALTAAERPSARAALPSGVDNAPAAAIAPQISRAQPGRWETPVALGFPLVVDGELLDRVTCRRITGRQMMDLIMQIGDVDEAALREAAYAVIAGVPPEVFAELEAGDLDRVMDAIRPFLPPALRDDLDGAALAAAAVTNAAG